METLETPGSFRTVENASKTLFWGTKRAIELMGSPDQEIRDYYNVKGIPSVG